MIPSDPQPWRDTLAGLRDPAVTVVLTVQCGLDWLRPAAVVLRDEVDEALARLALGRLDVRIDRIVRHNLPTVADVPSSEFAARAAAHTDWLYRLAAVGAMLPVATRPRVHRLIFDGGQHSVGLVDGIQLQINGTWADPQAASAALGIVRRIGATTPLTGYDVDMDGPFGDADPSVYL